VTSEVDEVEESFELSVRFGGKARLICGSGLMTRLSTKNDEADDLSDRKLDLPVSAALVSECSELPEESDGESCDFTEAVELAAGDLTLCSEDLLDICLSGALGAAAAICGNAGFCNGEGCAVARDGKMLDSSVAGV
jgi:hypothetical protein